MLYGTFNYLPRKYFRMETFRLLVLLICCGAAATTDIRTVGTFGDGVDWYPTIFWRLVNHIPIKDGEGADNAHQDF